MSESTLPNFYALKQKTHESIAKTVFFLAENPGKRVKVLDLVFEFMRLYGVGEIGVRNLLKPFLSDKQVFLIDGYLVGPANQAVLEKWEVMPV